MGLGGILVRVAVRSAVRAAMTPSRAHPGPYAQGPYAQGPYAQPYPQAYAPPRPQAGSSGCGMAFLILFAAGGLLLGLLCVVIGVGMMIAPGKDGDVGAGGAMLGVAFGMFLLPGGTALAGVLWVHAKQKRLGRLAVLAQTNARLPLATIAGELAVGPETARKILYEAIEGGLVRGRLDIEQDTFFSESVARPALATYNGPCRSCGAPLALTTTPGVPVACPYCRAWVV